MFTVTGLMKYSPLSSAFRYRKMWKSDISRLGECSRCGKTSSGKLTENLEKLLQNVALHYRDETQSGGWACISIYSKLLTVACKGVPRYIAAFTHPSLRYTNSCNRIRINNIRWSTWRWHIVNVCSSFFLEYLRSASCEYHFDKHNVTIVHVCNPRMTLHN